MSSAFMAPPPSMAIETQTRMEVRTRLRRTKETPSSSSRLKPMGSPAVTLDAEGGACTSAIATKEIDRKSTRLNSSHVSISYAVFCLKKKKIKIFVLNINNEYVITLIDANMTNNTKHR